MGVVWGQNELKIWKSPAVLQCKPLGPVDIHNVNQKVYVTQMPLEKKQWKLKSLNICQGEFLSEEQEFPTPAWKCGDRNRLDHGKNQTEVNTSHIFTLFLFSFIENFISVVGIVLKFNANKSDRFLTLRVKFTDRILVFRPREMAPVVLCKLAGNICHAFGLRFWFRKCQE